MVKCHSNWLDCGRGYSKVRRPACAEGENNHNINNNEHTHSHKHSTNLKRVSTIIWIGILAELSYILFITWRG